MRLFLLLALCVLISAPARAGEDDGNFTVIISDEWYREDATISPCYPVTGEFMHTNLAVTKVRMEYPYNPSMFMMFELNQTVRIELHENFMKAGDWSLSDFVALDDAGRE